MKDHTTIQSMINTIDTAMQMATIPYLKQPDIKHMR